MTRIRYEASGIENLTYVHVPLLSTNVLNRLCGLDRARRLSRAFNYIILKRLQDRINADIIFHADGCKFYPILKTHSFSVTDTQDDYQSDPSKYELEYGAGVFRSSRLNFAVTHSVADKFSNTFGAKFEALENGVDFETMRCVDDNDVSALRRQLGLNGKTIASYIGAACWLDAAFAAELFELAAHECPELHFVIVGNLPAMDFGNVTWAGPVHPDRARLFYHLSDVGIFLRDSGNDFLRNSMPLKLIQYSSIGKPVVSAGTLLGP